MCVAIVASLGVLGKLLPELVPVSALALGWAVFGDRISPISAAGAALALTGVSWGAWHISRDVLPEDASGPPVSLQPNWRWCHKCQGLFFAGNPGPVCAAGGAHENVGSGNYSLPGT